MKTKGDTGKRKTFVNTTLGETWEAKIGERPDAEVMAERKEHYSAPVPDRVAYLTAGIDSQLDRYEMRVWGWGPGEESWLIDRQIIMGRQRYEHSVPGDLVISINCHLWIILVSRNSAFWLKVGIRLSKTPWC